MVTFSAPWRSEQRAASRAVLPPPTMATVRPTFTAFPAFTSRRKSMPGKHRGVVLTGDAKGSPLPGADGKYHRVVFRAQLFQRDVLPEARSGPQRCTHAQHVRHRPVQHRGGKAIVRDAVAQHPPCLLHRFVDGHLHALLTEVPGGTEPRGAGPDNCDFPADLSRKRPGRHSSRPRPRGQPRSA